MLIEVLGGHEPMSHLREFLATYLAQPDTESGSAENPA
jgi:hypothetical protein